jgi:hypothetical protein
MPSATHLFFSDSADCTDSRMHKLPLAGEEAAEYLFTQTGGGCFLSITAHDGRLYWLHPPTGIHAEPIDALSGTQPPLVGVGGIGDFHVTATALFARSVYSRTVTAYDLDGTNAATVHEQPSWRVTDISGDEDSAWWVSIGDPDAGTSGYKIWRADRGSTVERAAGDGTVSTFAVHEDHVYFGTTNGEVWRLAKTGGVPQLVTTIDTVDHHPRRLAFAGDYVFVAIGGSVPTPSNGPARFYRAKKCGGRARPLARDYMYGDEMTIVGDHLYFGRVNELTRLEITKR